MQAVLNGDVSVSSLKKVSVEDLLGRDTIKVNIDEELLYRLEKSTAHPINSKTCWEL